MRARHYRLAGAFELLIRPRPGSTEVPVDLALLERWGTSVARRAGFDVRSVFATDGGLVIVAIAAAPRCVGQLARWVPQLRARPLHRVTDYVQAVEALRQHRRLRAAG